MSDRKPPRQGRRTHRNETSALIHVLKTHQVDAIVGQRHIMHVRLKQVEQKLKNSRDQVRALVASLQSIRENERVMISREIHDELGQKLTSLELGLSWLARKVTPKQQPLQKKIWSLSALVSTMIGSVRTIAEELRPGVLDELGLIKALESEAHEFKNDIGIPCTFKTNMGKAKFNRVGSIVIFRIAQTALTNVARHANASSAMMALMKRNIDVILTVNDNGKGISEELVHSKNSLGIIGMRERAIALAGTFSLRGSKAQGTTLIVRIPLSRVLIGDDSVSS